MRQVGVFGIGHTVFGNLSDFDLVDVMSFATLDALQDAGILEKRNLVEQVFVANVGGAMLNHQTGIASSLVSRCAMEPAMAELVENGPASGASAIKAAVMAIGSGMVDCALVTGGELMRAVSGWQGTDFVASLLHPKAEYDLGLTLPAFGGMFTRMYMERYGLTEHDLAVLAAKDHDNGVLNTYSHVRLQCKVEALDVEGEANPVNPYVAEPLRLYNMCPVSDGAAALVLCALDSPTVAKLSRDPVLITGIGSATDTHCVHERPDPLELRAVRLSAEKAFQMAGLEPKDISLAELHDAFIILELAISEEVGFFPRGKSRDGLLAGETRIGGRIPINTSGGLKAKGHPLGATGVSQVYELVKQLRGEAEKGRQVKNAKHGLAVNFGGFGNNVVSTICSKA